MLIKARTRKGLKHFRRAGHRFDMQLRSYEVSEDALKAIEAEPNVEIVNDENDELDALDSESTSNDVKPVDGDEGEHFTKASLLKRTKAELQVLAEDNEIDPDQNKAELVEELLEELG